MQQAHIDRRLMRVCVSSACKAHSVYDVRKKNAKARARSRRIAFTKSKLHAAHRYIYNVCINICIICIETGAVCCFSTIIFVTPGFASDPTHQTLLHTTHHPLDQNNFRSINNITTYNARDPLHHTRPPGCTPAGAAGSVPPATPDSEEIICCCLYRSGTC
jgi:hypothetical protein